MSSEASKPTIVPRFGYWEKPLFAPVCRCGHVWAIKKTPGMPWRCDAGHYLSFPNPPREVVGVPQ